MNDSSPLQDPLFQEAARAADSNVHSWIRATLREVALQSLQRSVQRNPEGALVLTREGIAVAQNTCRRVAQVWKEKLMNMQHGHVAQQIQYVVDQENETLYYDTPEKETVVVAATTTAPPNQERTMTWLGQLYKLGRRKDTLITQRTLDQFGLAGQTDWPFDWEFIQRLADDIPEKGNSGAAKQVTRKRKRTERQARNEEEEEEPRLPFDLPDDTMTHFTQGWSSEEKKQLDSYLHPEIAQEEEDDGSKPMLLLGALSDVGRFHLSQQLPVDRPELSWEDLSAKRRRRFQSSYIKGRLGTHVQVDLNRSQGRRERVSRVCFCVDHGVYWYDLDLSHCMLEFQDDKGEKRLLAFRHMDIMLLDEDEEEGSSSEDAALLDL